MKKQQGIYLVERMMDIKSFIKVLPLFILPVLLILSPLLDGFHLSSVQSPLAEDENGFKKIEEAEDLLLINEDLTGKYIITQEIDMADLSEWQPLTSEDEPFRGELISEEKIINMQADYVNEASKGLFTAMTEEAYLDVEVEFLQIEEKKEVETAEKTEETSEKSEEEVAEPLKTEVKEKSADKEEKLKKVEPFYLGTNEVETTAPDLPADYERVSFDEVFQNPIGIGTEFLSDTQLQITPDEKSNLGAIWSKDKLDFTRKFVVDTYMYLGNRGRNAADGITLTFQNDPRMKNNMSSVKGSDGMGIGSYSQGRTGYNDYIQNALSIEVDTYRNTGARDRIDQEIDNIGSGGGHNGHLAIVTPKPSNNIGRGEHSNITYATEPISNGEWHRMRVQWEPESSSLTYTFDHYPSQTYRIKDLNESFGGSEAYWGFTGSTGGLHALNVVAFKELPQHQRMKQTASLKNRTENGSYEEKVDVYNGDTLNYKVKTRYDSVDLDPWKDGRVIAKLPKGFNYVKASATLDGQAMTEEPVFDEANRELSFPKMTLDEVNREKTIAFDLLVTDAKVGSEKISVRGEAAVKKVEGNDVSLQVLAPKEGFVNVHYIDSASHEKIKASQVITGLNGEKYEAKAEKIPGYVLEEDKLPANQTGEIIAGKTIDVNFLYREGKLYISEVPDEINFTGKISSSNQRYFFNKSEMNRSLIVTDERKAKSDWSVEVMISKQLTGENSSRVLLNSLYYQTKNQDDILLNEELQAVIKQEYQGINEDVAHFNLSDNWAENKEGFYLRVAGASVRKDNYHGELTWNLVNAP